MNFVKAGGAWAGGKLSGSIVTLTPLYLGNIV
jgi:hypothetical protein